MTNDLTPLLGQACTFSRALSEVESRPTNRCSASSNTSRALTLHFAKPTCATSSFRTGLFQKAVVGVFLNGAPITRLVGARMLDQNDEWSLNRRYMQLEGLQTVRLPAVAR